MLHPYADLPEVADLDGDGGLLRIPNQQDVPFTPRVRALVDTAEFQRLGHISQLGLASRVYPGATHTRFEHALGVYHNALRYLRQLGRDPRFANVVDVHTAEVLIVAALLHDVGHWPFCHPIEDLELAGLPDHEDFAREFLGPSSELAAVLKSDWQIDPAEVLDVLVAKTDEPRLRLVRSILSGPIDIDKMDYLQRDSLHAGVPYGSNFDRGRLVHSLVVNSTGDGLAISAKGRTAAELMVFARYVMFSEVYWHHAVRSATCMFGRAFFELASRLNLDAVFRLSEADMIRHLQQAAIGTPWAPLLDGVFGPRRLLHKRVLEVSRLQSPELYDAVAGRPYRQLQNMGTLLLERLQPAGVTWPAGAILIDAPPARREVEFRVEIFYPKEGVYRLLTEVSPVVEALARTQFDSSVKRVRVLASRDVVPLLPGAEVLAAALAVASTGALQTTNSQACGGVSADPKTRLC